MSAIRGRFQLSDSIREIFDGSHPAFRATISADMPLSRRSWRSAADRRRRRIVGLYEVIEAPTGATEPSSNSHLAKTTLLLQYGCSLPAYGSGFSYDHPSQRRPTRVPPRLADLARRARSRTMVGYAQGHRRTRLR